MIKVPTRRGFLSQVAGGAVLSAAGVALLGGREALAAGNDSNPSGDVAILNIALALEHEGIAAYQIGAESGLLQKPVLDIAVGFQSQHKAHRDALIAAIERLGGKPVGPLKEKDYKKSKKLGVASIKSQTDILRLAQRLELGAVNAYLGVIPAFTDHDLAKVAGRLAADETMHYTVLTQALNDPLPTAALSYGA